MDSVPTAAVTFDGQTERKETSEQEIGIEIETRNSINQRLALELNPFHSI